MFRNERVKSRTELFRKFQRSSFYCKPTVIPKKFVNYINKATCSNRLTFLTFVIVTSFLNFLHQHFVCFLSRYILCWTCAALISSVCMVRKTFFNSHFARESIEAAMFMGHMLQWGNAQSTTAHTIDLPFFCHPCHRSGIKKRASH